MKIRHTLAALLLAAATAFPSLVSAQQSIAVNNATVTSLTPGNCVQAGTGGKLTTASAACGGTTSQSILAEDKPTGVPFGVAAKAVAINNNATATLLNLTGQSGGYVSYLWIGFSEKDVASTMTITEDGNTVFNDRACLFFGAEYQSNQSSFVSRFLEASNNDSNNVGFGTWIPIPFNASISITFTNKSGSNSTLFYTIIYSTGVPDSWRLTNHLFTSSGTIAAATPQSVQTLLNATSLQPGRVLGIAFSIDSVPGSANPAVAPLEGEFKFYIDGSTTPGPLSSGTEDLIGMSNYFQGFPASTLSSATNGYPYASDYAGLTIGEAATWNAYRFFIMDPIAFTNGIKVTWDAGESSVSWTGTVRFAYCIWYYTQ